mgnify:CR=1 FL=1
MKTLKDCRIFVLAQQATEKELLAISRQEQELAYEDFVVKILSFITEETSLRETLRTLNHFRIDLEDLKSIIENRTKKKCVDCLCIGESTCTT